jgi:glucoamylase
MMRYAPGGPGIEPRWTSSDKAGIGTALSALSRVWFTLSHGILNEIYYPRVDQACTRDFGFLVTNGADFFSEEKRAAHHRVERIADGVPSFRLLNTCIHGRYLIDKRIISDPWRDVVMQSVRLQSLNGERLRLFPLLSPHLVNGGAHNTGWIGEYKGVPMLFAEGGGTALALAADVPWLARSAGFVGSSDGWLDVSRHSALTETYDIAKDGNVALCGELDVGAAEDGVLLTLGFGRNWSEAAFRAKASLETGFEVAAEEYAAAWKGWQSRLLALDRAHTKYGHNTYRISTSVLRAHDSPSFPGGIIASLSIPWGYAKGDDDMGGYHLIWPRDLGETAGALIACGASRDARRILEYLRTIQELDGRWPQNTWLDGVAYWRGLQMDEVAFPILIVDQAHRAGFLRDGQVATFWPMVRRAAAFVVRHGPITDQDRWEEDGGFSPFTLAVEIAGLLAAADLAEQHGAAPDAALFRDTADAWNARLEEWCYAVGTRVAREAGVEGYYVRITPPNGDVHGQVAIKNRPPEKTWFPACEVISPDALALVRFGLRDAHDPRILNTVRVIDHRLRVELPTGPCWYRYNEDGYGEHEDGSAFDGIGIGRLWPLMTGERAHYELAAGDIAESHRLLNTMETLTSRGGLIPEQVWDADDISERELKRGEPSGSAMPLVWAHAEHVKLCRSLADGAVFDMPPQTVKRYLKDKVQPACAIWKPDLPCRSVEAGQRLRIDLPERAVVVWTANGWSDAHETATRDTGLGLHIAEINAPLDGHVVFTWRRDDGSWAGQNYDVRVTAAPVQAATPAV